MLRTASAGRSLERSPIGVETDEMLEVILGFDMGSTGSKVVALDMFFREPL